MTADNAASVQPEGLRVEAVALEQLAPLPGNPRRGNVAAVARSYERFGQRRPIVARHLPDGSAQVTAGCTQLEAARRLGWPTILVAWHEDADDVAQAWGSTLIAADGLARRAVLVDVDPRWCDVTCRRWQTYSDVPPVLERTGQPVDFCS